ncbi:hypothetical protein EDD17DRAFT_1647247 [Pisolithus thermaeus]|nr:hypothetical protein EDD17DRAFT_1647247 [Pisolithus thermaeus]
MHRKKLRLSIVILVVISTTEFNVEPNRPNPLIRRRKYIYYVIECTPHDAAAVYMSMGICAMLDLSELSRQRDSTDTNVVLHVPMLPEKKAT